MEEAPLPPGENGGKGERRVNAAGVDDAGRPNPVLLQLGHDKLAQSVVAHFHDRVTGDAHFGQGDRTVDRVAAGGQGQPVKQAKTARRRIIVDRLADRIHTTDPNTNDVTHRGGTSYKVA